ncbi:MAG: hypothetical protein V3U96_11175 [Paracoccaceae bacterium]
MTGISTKTRDNIPQAWVALEHDIDVTERKVKTSLRLDESVAKYNSSKEVAKTNDLKEFIHQHRLVNMMY